ncbi:MAG: hypothetical protein K2K97_00025 [Muribaculaceae bacterium]|nr:hypothetical protein [Muribaculaceae bacterium]
MKKRSLLYMMATVCALLTLAACGQRGADDKRQVVDSDTIEELMCPCCVELDTVE